MDTSSTIQMAKIMARKTQWFLLHEICTDTGCWPLVGETKEVLQELGWEKVPN